jgi:hypothetical protein
LANKKGGFDGRNQQISKTGFPIELMNRKEKKLKKKAGENRCIPLSYP